MKKSFRLTSLILPLLLAAIFFFPTQAEAAESTDFSDLGIAKIYTRLYSYYDIDDSVLQAQDIESLAAALAKIDPYSRYLTAEQFTALNESYDPSYTGIGVVLEMNADNKVAIKVVFADSVAAAAQFLPGDVIHSVNGVLTAGKSTTEVSQMLQGDVKELLTIEIERNGYIVKYEMARKEMTTPSVFYWMLDNEVAYMADRKIRPAYRRTYRGCYRVSNFPGYEIAPYRSARLPRRCNASGRVYCWCTWRRWPCLF